LFKLETAYGVDAVPDGTNGILMTNVKLTPMAGEDLSRELVLPYMGGQPRIPTDLYGMLEGDVELVGSGVAGTPPPWAPLIKVCGTSEVVAAGASVTYKPESENFASGTLYFWMSGTRHVLKGCRGSMSFALNAQGLPKARVKLWGLWQAPGEAARVVPSLAGFQKPLIVKSATVPVLTANGVPLVMRSFEMDMGNQVERRLLVGSESIIITDRLESLDITVEAVPVTTFDPYAPAADETVMPVIIQHGTVAGRRTTLTVPAAQMNRLEGYEEKQGIAEWPLKFTPLPVNGNDQWTLVLT
jgi:hypothetical protein